MDPERGIDTTRASIATARFILAVGILVFASVAVVAFVSVTSPAMWHEPTETRLLALAAAGLAALGLAAMVAIAWRAGALRRRDSTGAERRPDR